VKRKTVIIPLAAALSALALPESSAMNDAAPAALRQLLIDSSRNLRIAEWSAGAADLDLDTPHRWRVRKYVLRGGRQEGVDMVEVDNGVLSFKVIPTRGMNLWDGRCDGLRLGWDSPVAEVVHPQFVELGSRGGLGWLEGFGEWINRCGLESNGLPGEDRVTSNTGEVVKVNLTLHGKISYIPASRVEVVIEPPPSRRIRVLGVVDETMMFGPRLRLLTEISTEPGSRTLHIRDEVHNLAATPQEMQLLYHSNFGAPLLEEGARFVAPLKRVSPRDQRAAEGIEGWSRFGPPEPGYVEQVYFLELAGDEAGRTEALLHDAARSRGVSLAFSLAELPYMTLWKNTAARENGYVTGLEPATNYPNLRSIERARGRVPVLQDGQVYRAGLSVTAHTKPELVQKALERIAALQKGVEAVVSKQPE
jgi:hypothetical protein